MRLVLELTPKYFVFENVPGLTVGKHQNFLLEIIEEFTARKYEVDYKVLNAANYGVPQDRARLFLLGCRQGLPLPKYPQPLTKTVKSNQSKYLVNFSNLPIGPTVWDALCDLPEVEKYPELLDIDWAIAEYGKPSNYSSQLRGLFPREGDYSYERLFDPRILTSSLRTNHSVESIARFSATNPGEIEPISRFYKLSPQGICNTLRAGTASNRGSFTAPRPIHPLNSRCITVREAARLHSYPDWFRFHMTKWHGFRQIGNSVPPLLAKAVATEIVRALGVVAAKPKAKFALGDDNLLQLNMSQAAHLYGVPAHVIEPRTRQTRKSEVAC